jgi:hypothetical protein
MAAAERTGTYSQRVPAEGSTPANPAGNHQNYFLDSRLRGNDILASMTSLLKDILA